MNRNTGGMFAPQGHIGLLHRAPQEGPINEGNTIVGSGAVRSIDGGKVQRRDLRIEYAKTSRASIDEQVVDGDAIRGAAWSADRSRGKGGILVDQTVRLVRRWPAIHSNRKDVGSAS